MRAPAPFHRRGVDPNGLDLVIGDAHIEVTESSWSYTAARSDTGQVDPGGRS